MKQANLEVQVDERLDLVNNENIELDFTRFAISEIGRINREDMGLTVGGRKEIELDSNRLVIKNTDEAGLAGKGCNQCATGNFAVEHKKPGSTLTKTDYNQTAKKRSTLMEKHVTKNTEKRARVDRRHFLNSDEKLELDYGIRATNEKIGFIQPDRCPALNKDDKVQLIYNRFDSNKFERAARVDGRLPSYPLNNYGKKLKLENERQGVNNIDRFAQADKSFASYYCDKFGLGFEKYNASGTEIVAQVDERLIVNNYDNFNFSYDRFSDETESFAPTTVCPLKEWPNRKLDCANESLVTKKTRSVALANQRDMLHKHHSFMVDFKRTTPNINNKFSHANEHPVLNRTNYNEAELCFMRPDSNILKNFSLPDESLDLTKEDKKVAQSNKHFTLKCYGNYNNDHERPSASYTNKLLAIKTEKVAANNINNDVLVSRFLDPKTKLTTPEANIERVNKEIALNNYNVKRCYENRVFREVERDSCYKQKPALNDYDKPKPNRKSATNITERNEFVAQKRAPEVDRKTRLESNRN